VVASRNSGPHVCKDVVIEHNVTPEIIIAGEPASDNIVRYNIVSEGEEDSIKNQANASLSNNRGY